MHGGRETRGDVREDNSYVLYLGGIFNYYISHRYTYLYMYNSYMYRYLYFVLCVILSYTASAIMADAIIFDQVNSS